MKTSLLQDNVIITEWAGILSYTCEMQIPGQLPCEMTDIAQPSAIKPAEDEVSDIHSGSTSSEHHGRRPEENTATS
jgi:hypothetical protein